MTRASAWLQGLRWYLAAAALGNAIWELAQLPLYTIWRQGSPHEKLVALSHCTGGDMLIALSTWALACVIAGNPGWPGEGFRRVAVLTVAFGFAYTGFSEWLNTAVRQSWEYSALMPVIPGLRIGLSPMLQWLAVPSFSLSVARQRSRYGAPAG